MDWLTDIFGGPLGTNLFGAPGGGAGKLFGDMAVPGMPTTVPNMPPTNGLLRAGDDDMRPPGLPMPGAGLLKAGMEGPLPPTPLADVPAPGAAVAQGGPGTPGFAIPGQPPLATPAGTGRAPDPDRFPSSVPGAAPTIPNSRGGPDERGAPQPVPIVPPKLDTTQPTAGGTPIVGGGAPAAAPAPAAPAAPGAAQPAGGGDAAQRIRDMLGKMSAPPKTPPPQGHAPGSPGGDPAAASRQGSAQLFQSILDAHAKAMPAPFQVPALPKGLLERFRT